MEVLGQFIKIPRGEGDNVKNIGLRPSEGWEKVPEGRMRVSRYSPSDPASPSARMRTSSS